MSQAAGEHHDPNLAHHFDSPGQQYASAKTGMWVFLATEILMFGGLFCAYAVYRRNNPEIFEIGHHFLDSKLGAINTVVLLLSSFTMAWAVRAAQMNQKRLTVALIAITFLGGCGFMGIKYAEYSHKIHLGLAPGFFFNPDLKAHETHPSPSQGEGGSDAHATEPGEGETPATPPAEPTAETPTAAPLIPGDEPTKIARPADAPHGLAGPPAEVAHDGDYEPTEEELAKAYMFFNIYYLMTGLHGVHVLIGMGIMIWLIRRAARGDFSDRYFTAVDLGGLYWHLVDLIWIFLFPLLYLIH